jgi:oligopeptidase B
MTESHAQTNKQTPKNVAADAMPAPPVARKAPKVTKLHGITLTDDYSWMREKTNPEVIKHLEAENAYTDAALANLKPLQEKLYKEFLGRIKQTDLSVPYRLGDYFYFSRTEEGKQYPIYSRKRGSLDAPEEVMLDLNKLAEGKKFLSLGASVVSDDGRLLAYSTDETGYRQYTLHVKDLTTGETLPVKIERTGAVMWATDNKTIFYTTEDETTKRSDKLFRHTLGASKPDGSTDPLVHEEKDELYRLFAGRTRDRKYILVGAASSETTEFRYIPTDKPESAPVMILPRVEDHEYYVDHRDGLFYIRTNDNAKNFRLVTAPVADPSKKNWKEIIAHRPDTKLEDVDLFRNHHVVSLRRNGLEQLLVTNFSNGKSHAVEFPEPAYTVGGSANPEYDTNVFRYQYQSLVTPSSVFDYDTRTQKSTLLKEQEIPSGYDKSKYTSERIFATAADGKKIPISLVYKKGTKRDAKSPMLLYAYGSYGIPQNANFSATRLSLLERGVVFAMAHIRGGGDMGEEWHDDGKMMNKKNTFTDFIAAAEHLTKEKYTAKDRLAIMGGSAGGLLMGAVANMRPDLFHTVISLVPFVDVMNTMLDASLPLTVGEYLEWGDPNKPEAFKYMLSYSPYDNIERKAYPTTLVRTGLNDSQVMYWEPAKVRRQTCAR